MFIIVFTMLLIVATMIHIVFTKIGGNDIAVDHFESCVFYDAEGVTAQ